MGHLLLLVSFILKVNSYRFEVAGRHACHTRLAPPPDFNSKIVIVYFEVAGRHACHTRLALPPDFNCKFVGIYVEVAERHACHTRLALPSGFKKSAKVRSSYCWNDVMSLIPHIRFWNPNHRAIFNGKIVEKKEHWFVQSLGSFFLTIFPFGNGSMILSSKSDVLDETHAIVSTITGSYFRDLPVSHGIILVKSYCDLTNWLFYEFQQTGPGLSQLRMWGGRWGKWIFLYQSRELNSQCLRIDWIKDSVQSNRPQQGERGPP